MVDNELITKVRIRNVKSILSNVFTSNTPELTNGNGTTANGSAVDLGGVINGSLYSGTEIYPDTNNEQNFSIGKNGNAFNQIQFYSGDNGYQMFNNGAATSFTDFGYDGLGGTFSPYNFNVYFNNRLRLKSLSGIIFDFDQTGIKLDLGSDATGDQYHRNASGYLVRRGTVSAASTSSLTINSDTTYQYSLTALAAALSIEAPTGTPFNGQDLLIRIKDNATARGLTWNAIFRVIGVTLPTTTVISKTMYIACIYNSTDTKWDVIGVREQA